MGQAVTELGFGSSLKWLVLVGSLCLGEMFVELHSSNLLSNKRRFSLFVIHGWKLTLGFGAFCWHLQGGTIRIFFFFFNSFVCCLSSQLINPNWSSPQTLQPPQPTECSVFRQVIHSLIWEQLGTWISPQLNWFKDTNRKQEKMALGLAVLQI